MARRSVVRGVKCAGVVAAAVALTASVGPASAATMPSVLEPVDSAVSTVPVVATVVAAGVTPQAASISAAAAVRPAQRPTRLSAQRARAAAYARFTAFTLSSKATRDMRGVEKSLYHGRYYTRSSETKRLCIVRRESEGHYDVVSRHGTYRGAYQVSAALARGATWMMLAEHKKLMGASNAKRVLAKLRSTPMNRWPRYWQDAAFHTIINWDGSLSGASHWAGGRWHC